jgi:chromosome segregation protein
MTGASRLLSVRLQGFKSFAERTHVEFGPGISAVVGPNGSGKSNLADALRWALGEQGRALRSRKAEDVIWAGSERRPALGMADVQLVIDNADGLLPVEYGVVELGRRLYRSGENDYLLNRQRVRLRDLVELLDGAHLADNAFLFIGQGMVDQALALRPEERRPLFEEVAGVRRHERRRRRAEEQLAESEANLARADDILGELRPQARRLAAQAEQQASRRSAADELAAAILSVAHARWHAAAARTASAAEALAAARGGLNEAMSGLEAREAAVADIASQLAGRSAAEAERRAELDAAQGHATDLRIRAGAVASELTAVERDRARIAAERPTLEAELNRATEVVSRPAPARDLGLEADLDRAEAALAAALGEAPPTDDRVEAADEAVIRRLEAARRADAETARRRLAEAERVASVEGQRARTSAAAAESARAIRADAGQLVEAAAAEMGAAREARTAAEGALAEAQAAAASADRRAAAERSTVDAIQGRLEAVRFAIAELDRDPFTTSALARGGRRLDPDVVVEPDLRLAVRAALAGLGRAVVVARGEVEGLSRERGAVVVEEAAARAPLATEEVRADEAAFIARVVGRGGGHLPAGIRRDDRGTMARLLARVAWLPDLAACLDLQAQLPPGWTLVPRDGRAIVADVVVQLGVADPAADARAEVERLSVQARAAEEAVAAHATAARDAARLLADRAAGVQRTRDAEVAAIAALRRAEEHERAMAGALDGATREAAWLAAQVTRLDAEVERLRATVRDLDPTIDRSLDGTSQDEARASGATAEPASERASEARIAAFRATRDRLAALMADHDAKRQAAERERAAAEAAIALGRSRIGAFDAMRLDITERETRLDLERRDLERELSVAVAGEREARQQLEALVQRDAADRRRLTAAEADAARARETLAAGQAREQAAERESLEARLALDGIREQALVELAGLGRLGLDHLRALAGTDVESGDPEDESADDLALAHAVEVAAPIWAATQPPEAPTPGRLATLRRRFHELGAGNPYAVEEFAEVKARLDGLESQRADLQAAIDKTRALITELDSLIVSQFRTTFEALERAFEARFIQLFGGGYARLSLTDPSDLSATGVEIVARPPGKKPQPLAMLSGGERALTAVALLFAMLEVRPVPFCVLDEVDAALDEANIGRFTDALRELSARTQCIVITHNRGTIEVADALYGVTVGEDSVSRVISLRLEDAAGIAGDRAAERVGDDDAALARREADVTLEASRAAG